MIVTEERYIGQWYRVCYKAKRFRIMDIPLIYIDKIDYGVYIDTYVVCLTI